MKFIGGYIFIFCIIGLNSVFALNSFKSSVFQIVAYSHDQQNQLFVPEQYGSSISIAGGNIITNAHVILDEKQEPLLDFEICGIIDQSSLPKCFASATLLYYDPDIDLAMLKINVPYIAPNTQFASSDALVGSVTLVKGYPGYGLGTATTTRGVLAGEYGDYQKIDADLDEGNSGGAAFDEKFKLIGMPTFTIQGNNTLGYIIPLSKIKDFIIKKGVIMYPKGKTASTFKTYLAKKHKQLSSKSINDLHFALNIPTDFYLKNMFQTQDSSLSQYELMSKNQNVSVTIKTDYSIGAQQSKFEKNKNKKIEEYEKYFNDVIYTQDTYKNTIHEQIIAKGTESDKFSAIANTTIFKDQHYTIDIDVEGKTFDKNFQKGLDISKLITIKPLQKNQTASSSANPILEVYGLQIPVTDGIEIHKSIGRLGRITNKIHLFYQQDSPYLYVQELNLKRIQDINDNLVKRSEILFSDSQKPYLKTKLIKNSQGVIMVVSEFVDYNQKETKIAFSTLVMYNEKPYLLEIDRYVDHDHIQDSEKIYALIDKIAITTTHAGIFSKETVSLDDFRAIKLADPDTSEDDLKISTGLSL